MSLSDSFLFTLKRRAVVMISARQITRECEAVFDDKPRHLVRQQIGAILIEMTLNILDNCDSSVHLIGCLDSFFKEDIRRCI